MQISEIFNNCLNLSCFQMRNFVNLNLALSLSKIWDPVFLFNTLVRLEAVEILTIEKDT